MKNFKKIFLSLLIILLGFSGVLFGCGDKYSNLKIQTDLFNNTIELVCSNDNSQVSKSFNATVSGASGDISTSIKYYLENSGLVSVSLSHSEGSQNTTITLTALDYGETDLVLRTEGGNKTTKVHVIVTLAVEDIAYNSDYKPYAVIGKTTKLNTAKCVSFSPAQTTQKDVFYEMVGAYNNVEVFEDGSIIVGDEAINGNLRIRATSKSNPTISTTFDVKILRGVDDIIVEESETRIEDDKVLQFSNNMTAESLKILTFKAQPQDENNYSFEYRIVGSNDDVESDIFGFEEMDDSTLALTAVGTGNARLKIVAKLDGYEYASEPKYLMLKSVEVPSVVSVTSSQTTENIMVYDTYQNGLGEIVRVYVGGANADDRRFVISVDDQDRDKITIYTGSRNAYGQLVATKFYDGRTNDFDIYPNGTTLYIIANSDAVSDSATMNISFIAYGSLNLRGDIVKKDVNLELRRGVTRLLSTQNQFIDDMIMVPVSQNEEKFQIKISTNPSEWTDSVQTEFESDGLILETKIIKYENSTIDENGLTRDYIFNVYGVKDGVYYLNFYTKNGNHIDIKVRVFTKVTELTITTASIEENSDIGEIIYSLTPTNLPTLDGGNITIKYRGNVKLNINAYNGKNLQNCTYKNVEYEYNSNYIRIDSSNNMLGYAVNNEFTDVKVIVTVFDDESYGGSKTFEFTFKIRVYVALQSVSLSQSNAIIYTKSTLSDYVGEDGLTDKQRYGEFEFVLKINPEKTIITEDNLTIKWSGQEIGDPNAFKYVYDFDYDANVYKIKVWSEYITNLIGQDDTTIERNVRFTITIIQFQRTVVREGNIVIKQASKVANIYNIKKVQDEAQVPVGTQNGELYLYFDSRNMSGERTTEFTLIAQTNPTEVLNNNMVILVGNESGYDDVLTVEDNIVTLNQAGIAYLYLCSQDSCISSEIKEPSSYLTKVRIKVKVADGLSKATSLDISNASDLAAINNNLESLEKFYTITRSFNISYKNWTPIGIINGEVYDFDGNIDGLISDDYGETVNAIITGFNINGTTIVSNIAYGGLFARLGINALLQNFDLHISGVSINQNVDNILTTYFGGVAGVNKGTIQNVSVQFINGGKDFNTDVNINDNSNNLFAGGIVGQNDNSGFVKNVTTSGYVNVLKNLVSTSIYFVGGVVGVNNGTIEGKTSFFNKTEFEDSYTSSIQIIVKQTGSTDQIVATGGIAGKNINIISKVSFDGSISARDNVGGIVGYDNNGQILETFSSGFVSGNISVGGLVGKANDINELGITTISNSSVMVFDAEEVENPNIIGSNRVGGLVGSLEGYVNGGTTRYSTIENSYIRSYVKSNRTNFNGDIYVQSINAYVGGVAGYLSIASLNKVYSKITINAENATIGGVAGYANSYIMTNLYEQNKMVGNTQYDGLIIGSDGENSGSINYFYSSHNGVFVPEMRVSASNLVDDNNIQNVATWNLAIGNDDLTGADWYLENEGEYRYPYLLFASSGVKTVMAVEPPTEIKININTSTSNASKYLRTIKDENGTTLEDTYIIFKGTNSSLRFSDLFNVIVLPESNILNISKAYTLSSSNTSIVQIVGKTQGEYKLKLSSTGVVTITATSKLDADVKKSITIYVLNAVKNFTINKTESSTIVGSLHELKISMAQNYANNSDFYIKIQNNNYNILFINGVLADIEDTSTTSIDINSHEKIFVGSKKSGKYTISYTLFVELVIEGKTYYIDLPNDTDRDGLVKVEGQIELNFVYGINNFVVDAKNVETGFNDVAQIIYTLTGDDLRLTGSGAFGKSLPKLSWQLNDAEMNLYWQVELSYANVYLSIDENSTPTTLQFTKISGRTGENIDDYLISGMTIFNSEIVKIEFVFRIEINEQNAKAYYDEIANKNIKLESYMTCRVSILNDSSNNDMTTSREGTTHFVINRQKIDSIGLDFYTTAERKISGGETVGYTINETPSKAIVAGQEGLLKVALSPLNAEIKNVKIYYTNLAGFNLSMRQSLKNTQIDYDNNDDISSNIISTNLYIDRKPFAIAINNGKGLDLYHKESNYYFDETLNKEVIEYDGYLYITCVIPSSVPSGQIFKITVEALYTDDNLYVASTELVSKAHSSISINYNFNGVMVDEYSYIATGIEKEFYVDFVEFVDAVDVANLKSKYSAENVFGSASANSEYARIEFDRAININGSSSSYRVYYKILPKNLGKVELYISLTKTDNNVSTTYTSNKFTFEVVPYVITGFTIDDGGNNTLIIPQNSPRPLGITINAEAKIFNDEETKTKTSNQIMAEYIANIKNSYETIIDGSDKENKANYKLNFYNAMINAISKNSKTSNFNDYYPYGFDDLKSITQQFISNSFEKYQIALNIIYLQEKVAQNYQYWYGTANGQSIYTKLYESQTAFNNYAVSKNTNNIVTISVKEIDTTAIIYSELPIVLNHMLVAAEDKDKIKNPIFDFSIDYISQSIGDYQIGIIKHSENNYGQYLRDNVVLNLSSDVSAENPTPITTAEEFLNMKSGTNGEIMYYALNSDIVLENYRPISLTGISFDGNEHIISISNFKPVDLESADNQFLVNYALFETIDENSIVKNLKVNIEGLVIANDESYRSYSSVSESGDVLLQTLDTTNFGIGAINFGAVCATNNGSIFNVLTTSKTVSNIDEINKEIDNETYVIRKITLGEDNTLRFINTTSNQVYISGFVATNAGYITNSTSAINIIVNCGYVAGFVALNNKNISACKVIFDGIIENTLTTSENSLTAGFVTKNSGSINASYVAGKTSNENLKLISRSALGGFVNQNTGSIKDSYADIFLDSTSRSGGFVYDNSGTIQSSYTNNIVASQSSAHMPFVATDSTGNYIDTGEIDDCYYIDADNDEQKSYVLIVDHPNVEEIIFSKATRAENFKKFIFNKSSDDIFASVWTMGSSKPELVDANIVINSEQTYMGLATSNDGLSSYYSWNFVNSDLSYGQSKSGVINPRIINNYDAWNKIISEENKNDYFVIVNDITATTDTPKTSTLDFKGVLFGNNMSITGLYLRANSAQSKKNFGLFASMKDASLKNLRIIPKEVISNNANNVGTLAGYIVNSYISDINIDATDIVIQGRNMVGVFAGLINSSQIIKVDVVGNVNAGYRDSTSELNNFVSEDLDLLTRDDASFVKASSRQSGKTYYYDSLSATQTQLYYSEDGENFVQIENSKVIYVGKTYKYINGEYKKIELKIYDSADENAIRSVVLYEIAYIPYSYSGTFAGAVIATDSNESKIININVSGQNKIVGYYSGSIVGLIGERSILSLANTKIQTGQNNTVVNYVRAYGISGGIVGENRGTIDRCYIEHENDVQQLIDSNTTNTYITNRNLSYFVGSPKFIGGLVGFNNGGTIKYSYSKIDVRASNYVTKASGGLVGLDVGGTIKNCYATGSVINRYIIGGLIGVVTNKETLLGCSIPTQNEGADYIRNDYEYVFASNYEYEAYKENYITKYRQVINSNKRCAFVAGSITDNGVSSNLLTMNNNLASNKWLLTRDTATGMTDITMLNNAVSGLLIGSIVDHLSKNHSGIYNESQKGYKNISLSHVFNSSMFTQGIEIETFRNINNYVNTQVLKGRTTTTTKTITLSEILQSFVNITGEFVVDGSIVSYETYYNQTDANGIKQNLLSAIEYASIGGYSEIISLASLSDEQLPPSTKMALCTINNAIISFENILNVDDIVLGNASGLSSGLFTNYNPTDKTYFILPNREESKTRYYPEIIVNINI